nr:hypothetical protein [Pandoravirus belohorizontensis]
MDTPEATLGTTSVGSARGKDAETDQDGTLGRAPYGQDEDALVDAALSCVRWDETVDMERLSALEHQHDVAVASAVVANAIARVESYPIFATAPRLTAPLVLARSGSSSTDAVAVWHKVDGTWRVMGRDVGAHAWTANLPLTCVQLAGLLAVCGRHPAFYLAYGDGGGNGQTYMPERAACYERMWLSRLVTAVSRRTGAWTGDEILRTRSLCGALQDILDARCAGGPLARVEARCTPGMAVPAGQGGTDLGACAASKSMNDALGLLARLGSQGVVISGDAQGSATAPVRCTISTMRHMLDRMYATGPCYLGMILPAEYKAISESAPLAAALFH